VRRAAGPVSGAAGPVTGAAPAARLLVLTDRRQAREPLPAIVARAVHGGARYVVLRERDLPRDERAALAVVLRAVLAPVGGRLIVAGPDPLGGDAVHLAARDPAPPTGVTLMGRSCHDEAELSTVDIENYVTVSPVFATESKPGYGPALGTAGLVRLCARVTAPVYALGGVTLASARSCVEAGATGIAVMGAIMRAPDPADYVEELLRAVTAAPRSARQTA
jgi:thiamine-phosphate pyrophosphorylase